MGVRPKPPTCKQPPQQHFSPSPQVLWPPTAWTTGTTAPSTEPSWPPNLLPPSRWTTRTTTTTTRTPSLPPAPMGSTTPTPATSWIHRCSCSHGRSHQDRYHGLRPLRPRCQGCATRACAQGCRGNSTSPEGRLQLCSKHGQPEGQEVLNAYFLVGHQLGFLGHRWRYFPWNC